MTFSEYEQLAQRTSNTETWHDKLENAIYGLVGEVGEIVDLWKKYRFQGHPLDVVAIHEELGDVLWYIVECIRGADLYSRAPDAEGMDEVPYYSLDIVAKENIKKLRRRYPDGFDAERSIHRV